MRHRAADRTRSFFCNCLREGGLGYHGEVLLVAHKGRKPSDRCLIIRQHQWGCNIVCEFRNLIRQVDDGKNTDPLSLWESGSETE